MVVESVSIFRLNVSCQLGCLCNLQSGIHEDRTPGRNPDLVAVCAAPTRSVMRGLPKGNVGNLAEIVQGQDNLSVMVQHAA